MPSPVTWSILPPRRRHENSQPCRKQRTIDRSSPVTIAAHTTSVGSEPHGGSMQTFSAKAGAARNPRIARGEGLYLWDADGRRLIDVSSGPVANNLGHGNKRVLAAMHAQADKVTFVHPSQFESEANLQL